MMKPHDAVADVHRRLYTGQASPASVPFWLAQTRGTWSHL